jgi:hypothetical protein
MSGVFSLPLGVVVAVGLLPGLGSLAPQPEAPLLPLAVAIANSALTGFPHQPIDLVDQVVDGSDFDHFRDRLRQALARRDVAFVTALLPPTGLMVDDQGPFSADMLNVSETDSPFWRTLEKMLAPQSCELTDYPGQTPDAAVWACPNISTAFLQQHPAPPNAEVTAYEFSHVVVVGRSVNVRSRPRLGTPVVGQLSNEVVRFDQRTWMEMMTTTPEVTDDPIHGWTPVILPNQVQGYVYNRYVYHPLGPRALFEYMNGQWRLARILTGE